MIFLRVIASCVLLATVAQSQTAKPPATKTVRISGVVVHAVTQQPLAGIDVSISPAEQRDVVTEATTGSDGRFVFENLTRGKFTLIAHGRGFSPQAYQQHGPYSTAVAVGPGLASENLVFAIVPDASISGTVFDEENEAVRNGDVLLFARDGAAGRMELRARGNLEGQGHYHFSHLPPGTYFVAVSAQPWYAADLPVAPDTAKFSADGAALAPQSPASPPSDPSDSAPLDVTYRTTFYSDATDPESATPIQLHPGERATADFTLGPVPALHLTVRNLSSDPNQPGTVVVQQKVFDQLAVPVQARTQLNGTGTVKLSGIPPGHLLLNLRSFNGKEWKSHVREMDVASDTEIDAAENVSGVVSIRGTVQFPGGEPIPPGAYLRFFNRESNESFGTPLTEKGTFDLQQTVFDTNSYQVAVFNVHDSIVQGVAATGAKLAGRTLILPRSGTVQLAVTMSKGLGRIDGTVQRDDKGVAQTMVVLVPEHQEGNSDLFRRDQSDSDGTFSLYQVLPGRYTVIAIANGWDLDWRNPAVLQPYLAHGQLLEITGPRTYKVMVPAQDAAMPSTGAKGPQ